MDFALDVGQSSLDPIVVVSQAGVVDPEEFQLVSWYLQQHNFSIDDPRLQQGIGSIDKIVQYYVPKAGELRDQLQQQKDAGNQEAAQAVRNAPSRAAVSNTARATRTGRYGTPSLGGQGARQHTQGYHTRSVKRV